MSLTFHVSRRGLAVATLAAGGLIGRLAEAVEAGQMAPDIDLPGSSIGARLSELKGQHVYLDFWASWCGPCRQSFPWMADMQRQYGSHGLRVLAINLDAKRADADAFLAKTPAGFALAFDSQGESARRMGVKGMPTSMLVGPDGRVAFVHQGFRLDQRAALEAKLVAALNQR